MNINIVYYSGLIINNIPKLVGIQLYQCLIANLESDEVYVVVMKYSYDICDIIDFLKKRRSLLC
jgi:hypothetical protein